MSLPDVSGASLRNSIDDDKVGTLGQSGRGAMSDRKALEDDDTLLQQVLAQFSVELRSPMPEEVVARIEEETPEVPAKYDLVTYEYENVEEPDKDSTMAVR